MNNFFDKFRLGAEKEDLQTVVQNIENSVAFRGTNLWILMFAIFVASLGLNVNSTAVIIGAMLISPLMGPIMGIGLAMGMNDVPLLRKAAMNYLVTTGVALATSTIFFLLSPLNDAHSEILARTAPNIYDVLIALFGGLAGIVAISSKNKGNVIPGVAIATALMPPLCTAGYGVATFQLEYFLGAFYLYLINTVFIALATLLVVQLLHFPDKKFQSAKQEKISRRIIWSVVVVTLLPSIYFGYDLVKQNKYIKNAERFITYEAHLEGDYLLSKKIDAEKQKISLVFGGKEISEAQVNNLKNELGKYDLQHTELEIKQGFSFLSNEDIKQDDKTIQLNEALAEKDRQTKKLQSWYDSIQGSKQFAKDIFAELKAQYPNLQKAIIQPSETINQRNEATNITVAVLSFEGNISQHEQNKISEWLKVRMKTNNINLIFQ